MESPSEPIALDQKVNQPPSSAGGKSRRVRASERSKTSIVAGVATFREHALQTIIIDPKSRIVTLPAPIATWDPVTKVSWTNFDMCVRYVIKFANGGGASDLARMGKPKTQAGAAATGGPDPDKSDANETEPKPIT